MMLEKRRNSGGDRRRRRAARWAAMYALWVHDERAIFRDRPWLGLPRRTRRHVTALCTRCLHRVHFDTIAPGESLAIRCLYCLNVYCGACARKHFRVERVEQPCYRAWST